MEDSTERLSYKFQRLRERLRDAIAAGELTGKLPGERVLARQFHVNAKTLSKALTDLAAEGLLDRTIGRGTFVRSAGEDQVGLAKATGRWLLVCKPKCEDDAICRALSRLNADRESVTDLAALRPSLVNQFAAVVDVHGSLPDATLRDLLLRSRRLVRIDAASRTFSTHAVMIDRVAAIDLLVRDLTRGGFRRLVIVDDLPGELLDAARAGARRLDGGVVIEDARPAAIPGIDGVGPDVVFIGASSAIAAGVRARFAAVGVHAPADVSVACVGVLDDADPDACSGHAVTASQVAQSVAQLLAEPQLNRPTTLWLAGEYRSLGTVRIDAASAKGDTRP